MFMPPMVGYGYFLESLNTVHLNPVHLWLVDKEQVKDSLAILFHYAHNVVSLTHLV